MDDTPELRTIIDDVMCDAIRAEDDRLIMGDSTGEVRGMFGHETDAPET